MRTVSFTLMSAAIPDVEACLAAAGLEHLINQPAHWNYPAGGDAVLYATCSLYNPDAFPEEHDDVIRSTGGRVPSVEIQVHVSGRVPGDDEIRWLAEVLLSDFDGLAFDDFLGPKHGWTLDEIRGNQVVDGFHFFDYREAYGRTIGEAG